MRRPLDYDAPCGYELVCRVEDLEEVEMCPCEYLLVVDGWQVCTDCGTAYGAVYGFSKVISYTRKRWRS